MKYKCIKDMYMDGDGDMCFKGGKEYEKVCVGDKVHFVDELINIHYVDDDFISNNFIEQTEANVRPLGFEIIHETCEATIYADEIDIYKYDIKHIDDLILVATKAKEIYDENFKVSKSYILM